MAILVLKNTYDVEKGDMVAKKRKKRKQLELKFYRPEQYTFRVLGGLSYSEADRPPFWSNDSPLLYKDYSPGNAPKMESLPLNAFPLIDDFEIKLEDMIDETGNSVLGYKVRFFSPSLGYIASFAWWDHATRDLVKDEFWVMSEHSGEDLRYGDPNYHPDRPVSVPLGNFNNPYTALEQGWEIVIAECDNYVYVLEGSLNEGVLKGYHSWFKVSLERYLQQWQVVKTACKKLIS